MTQVKHYTLSMYGIQLNNGSWMKCVDGRDWYSTKEIAEEILPLVVDNTQAPPPKPAPKCTVTEATMKHYRSSNARAVKAARSNARRTRRHGPLYS